MTKISENLSIFDKWEVYPCANCDHYRPLADLVEYGALVVCRRCQKQLEKGRAEREQTSLFDDAPLLF
jgi:uncharacterized paraquat-inducible protein A